MADDIMNDNLLEVDGLKVHFPITAGLWKRTVGHVRAVDDVSFKLKTGETLALVGESGCGKSVTALSIIRLIPKYSGRINGEIYFNNRNLLKLSEGEMQSVRGKEIGMIFQEPMTSLNPILNIGEQISESLVKHLSMSKVSSIDRVLELLEMVGIADGKRRIKDYPHQFSGVQRQRIMIAMALSCEPSLLIADEPTTSLDVTIQAQILELIKELSRNLGLSVLLITHNLGIVARYANNIAVMNKGKIVEYGSCEDVYKNPRHKYTIGLLNSVPRITGPIVKELATIQTEDIDGND